MSEYIKALDNVGLICHANKDNFLKFEKMGFQLYPLGRQGLKAGRFFIKGGTGSIAAHFINGGYFEMISIYNNFQITGGYKKILKKRGTRLIKFALELTSAQDEVLRLGKRAYGPMGFRRVFTSESKGVQDARFSIMTYPFPINYPIGVAGTEHLTPDITWQDDLLDHPNGTLLLSNVLIAVENLEETVQYYKSIFAEPFEKKENLRVCHFKNNSRLSFISRENLRKEFPDMKVDSDPFIAAVYFGVKDLNTAQELLKTNKVPFRVKGGQLVVPRQYVFNSTFIFEKA